MIAEMTEEQRSIVRQASQLAGIDSAADIFNMKLRYCIKRCTTEDVVASDIVMLYRLARSTKMTLEEVLDAAVERIQLGLDKTTMH